MLDRYHSDAIGGRSIGSSMRFTRREDKRKQQKDRCRRSIQMVLHAMLASIALALMLPSGMRADGSRPGQPYHYLHPPRALQDINSPPRSISRTFSRGALSQFWIAFTHDGQAGLSATGQPFDLPVKDTGIHVAIAPVETPSGLPDNLYIDGNAYSMSVRGVPSSRILRIRRPLMVTLRWPRLPHAVYRYTSGNWTQLCSLRQATYTPATITCTSTALGIVAAVVVGPRRTHPMWQSRLSDTLTHRTWEIIAVIVVLVLMVGIWFLMRQRGHGPSTNV
jgi:hypothetical protein